MAKPQYVSEPQRISVPRGYTLDLSHLLDESEIMAMTPRERKKYRRVWGKKWRKR